MFVKVYKLGEEEPVHNFPLGSHVIGRGPDLQCNDKRVSRNHATMDVAHGDVKLTALHINPCFIKAADSKTITVLPKDSTTSLNDGDSFALLPDDYWFRIKIVEEDSSSGPVPKTEIVSPEELPKRHLDTSADEAPPDKRIKTQENDGEISNEPNNVQIDDSRGNIAVDTTVADENDTNLQTGEADTASTSETTNKEVVQNADQIITEAASTSEAKNQEEGEIEDQANNIEPAQNEEITSSQDIGQDPAKDANASSSNPRPKREKCWYGAECYRKNPSHREEYTHPGDSDFESDPDDNRPTCSYGAACYRKNKGHRRDYKHPPGGPPSKTKKKRVRKKVDRLNVANSEDMREFSDSDSEDPFIVDDDSDEYVEDSDGDDSDWEDSQNVDEDSENLKRLVKEAKKFVK